MLQLSKTTSPNELLHNDCVTLAVSLMVCVENWLYFRGYSLKNARLLDQYLDIPGFGSFIPLLPYIKGISSYPGYQGETNQHKICRVRKKVATTNVRRIGSLINCPY